MALRAVLRKVLERLIEFTDETHENETIAHLRSPDVPSKATDSERGQQQLEQLLQKTKAVQLGQVQLLSLELVKEHFKDNWDSVKSQIQQIAELVIDKHLTNEDFHTQYAELSFLIVYAHVDQEAARLKNAIIGQDIAHHLVGTDLADTFVRSQTVVSFDESDLETEENPTIEGIAEIVEQKALSEEEAERRAFGAELGWHYEKLDTDFFGSVLSRIQYSFIPLWNVSRGVISNYIFQPTMLKDNDIIHGYKILPDPRNPRQVNEMDIFTLNLALPHLDQMVKEKGRYLVTLPVHYLTLTSSKSRARFLNTCLTMPEAALHYLVFEIHGVPEGIVSSTLLAVLQYLRKYSRATIIRFACIEQSIPKLSSTSSLHAVGIDYTETGLEDKTELKAFEQLALFAEELKYKTYLINAPTRASLSSAVSAGITYASSTTVMEPLPAPGGIKKFQVVDLYRNVETDFQTLTKGNET